MKPLLPRPIDAVQFPHDGTILVKALESDELEEYVPRRTLDAMEEALHEIRQLDPYTQTAGVKAWQLAGRGLRA